jgi:5-methylthioadenosine/S-adenosylhomocysteine deaminase
MNKPVLFRDITVLTPNDAMGIDVFSNYYVSIFQDSIIYAGNEKKEAVREIETKCLENGVPAEYEDYSGAGRILLPTFANGHSHLPMVLLKNTPDDLKFEDWLFNLILPREALLKPKDIYYASLLGMAEMINGGTGASSDMYFMSEETARAALETGFRLNLCHDGKTHDQTGWKSDPKGLANFKRIYHGAGNGLLQVSLMIHSIYLYPESLYPDLVSEAEESDVYVQVHLCETATEVENCRAKYHVSPIEAMANFGVFKRPCIAAHCVHLDDFDRRILSAAGVTVAHNPSSNMKLVSGLCDVRALRDAGVNVCLGTDGSASNNNLDMYLEMRLASFIGKYIRNDPMNIRAEDTLYMATRAGYKGIGFSNCGMIRAGMKADFQIVNCDNPSIWPIGDPLSAIVYSTPSSAVESVMIGGRFVKYRGELTTIDFEKVKAETRQSMLSINLG